MIKVTFKRKLNGRDTSTEMALKDNMELYAGKRKGRREKHQQRHEVRSNKNIKYKIFIKI